MEKRVHKLTFYHPKLERISVCLNEGYLVGGFIRDRLLGVRKESVDIDLAVPEAEPVVRCVERELSLKPFSFEKEKTVYSFVKEGFRLDISTISGSSIEEDLKKRDFTINAMAVDVRELFLPFNDDAVLIDPTGGFEDLERGIVRPVYDSALSDDPVRILRGVRFKLELGFSYHSTFLAQVEKAGALLKGAPSERLRDEIVKVLRENLFGRFLRELDRLRVFYPVFSELERVEEIPPSGVHQFSLKEHTLRCVELLETYALPRKGEILEEYGEKVGSEEFFTGFTDRECLKLVALYHDAGKPLTVGKKEGRLTFYGHDRVGAEIAKEALLRLSFGRKAARMAYVCIRHHLRPFFLYDLWRRGELTERALYRFFRDAEKYAFHVLLLSVADFGATSESFKKELPSYEAFVKEVISFYRERLEGLKPLLSGREIMEIKGLEKPDRCVGKIKEKLLELQALGKVKTKEEAVKAVKGISCESSDKE